ncbi:Short-chain reductase protein NovJ [Austwickia sp. TVS 96-490-7B]|uniref:3-oxoacyl-ACP reductase FabG n=1 Tax=Austwickia sp. TVS 96-490-7B TaxID=2830843 RepID=UPI001C5625F2|nr:3-oxoacyl-ACP reductase FabG [Austwickia sp. TVS 96-490-7B]MBW3083899.1 Short-chain reductase protein NovJ [Austwickia sp. TVS 96-490-7B]
MNTPPRTAIVTGAAQGIGAAIAIRLAAQGRAVAVLDRRGEDCAATVDTIRAAGGQAVAIAADVTDPSAVAAAVDQTIQLLSAPTILVNNAGIVRDALIHTMDLTDWDDVIAVHLRGAFLMTRAVQRHMVDARFGRIVTLSSTSALGNRGQLNYATAKAGLQGFTKTAALELGRFGITANAIAPGFIATDMTRQTAQRLGLTFDEFTAQAASAIPVGRVGTPDDIAALAAYLTGEESGFVSGQVIYAAGGPKS